MKIGIFGGTFDPFTKAHYAVVNEVLKQKLVDKVVVLPTIVKYYRSEKDCLFSNTDKKRIIEKWFEGCDPSKIVLSFYEYMVYGVKENGDVDAKTAERRYIDMLMDAKDRFGRENEYFTIIGSDSWNNLTTWHEWEKLVDMTKFIVVVRGEDELKPIFVGGIQHLDHWTISIDDRFANVSATEIRHRLVRECSSMSMGPGATALSLYLEEIEEFKKSESDASTIESIEAKIDDIYKKLAELNDKQGSGSESKLKDINQNLKWISDILADPYKDTMCKWSLVVDIVEGRI